MKLNIPSDLKPEEDFIGKYARANIIHRYLLRGYFSAVQDLIALVPAGEVTTALEIGCGVGFSTERLLPLLSPTVKFEASEYLEWQVIEARKRLPRITFSQEDIFHLHRPDRSVDLIFVLEVLEHLDRVPAALSELHRVGTYVVIGVPHEPWWRILNTLRGKYLRSFGNTPGHINHWSGRSLKKLLTQSGFEVVASRSPLPWTLVLVKSRELKK